MSHERWSDRDISAYLDGQLAPERAMVFERSLGQNSVLRQRVDALRHTITLLRETPLRESPRNYLLTPSMVANPKPAGHPQRRSIGMMRLATSLTAAAFVVTLGLNVLTHRLAPAAVMERGADLVYMQDEAVQTQELEAPAMMLAEVPPDDETTAVQEKAVITEEPEPAAALAVEAPLAEGELKTAPSQDIEGQAEVGVGGGELPAAPEDTENLGSVEGDGVADAGKVMEQIVTEETTGAVELSAQPSEEENVLPNDELPIREDSAEDATLTAAPEALMAQETPGEQQDGTPRGIFRQLARLALPLWVPVALGIVTLLLLVMTRLLAERRL